MEEKVDHVQILSDDDRYIMIAEATNKFGEFLDIILPKWRDDDGLQETPYRVARMYVNELLAGLHENMPKMTAFNNEYRYGGMIFDGSISVKSMCEHHFAPFFGVAHVAYIPKEDGRFTGLSKLNRIVNHFSRRPQVQEKLTQQIVDAINEFIPDNRGVAVVITCTHTCVKCRGINDDSRMTTAVMTGLFLDNSMSSRDEFMSYVKLENMRKII